MLIIAGIVTILVPLLFLYVIYRLDLYATSSFRVVAICFVWGFIAFGLALGFNTGIKEFLLQGQFQIEEAASTILVVILLAPIVEEVVKSLVLIYVGRRPDFTYFVDGAVYGFAAGIGFSVLENFYYILPAGSPTQGAWAAIIRPFSTCLMHGSTSALVGVSIGRFRYGHGRTRILAIILGWGVAVALHSGFNRITTFWEGYVLLLGGIGVGVGGLILVALFIRWGLVEERRWIEEMPGLGVGVTEKEKALVLELDSIDELLQPVTQRFGREKAEMVEEFLLKQAKIGIRQKAAEMATDPRTKEELQDAIAILQAEMDSIRRQVGVYCMTYVRSIFPPESMAPWGNLERLVIEAQQRTPRFDPWSKLEATAAARATGGLENETHDHGQARHS